MFDEEAIVELLREIVPTLVRIEKIPMKAWIFSDEELTLLEKIQTLEFPPERYSNILRQAALPKGYIVLLSKARSLAVTRKVHGLDPKTGKSNKKNTSLVRELAVSVSLGMLAGSSIFYIREIISNRSRKNFNQIFLNNIDWSGVGISALLGAIGGVVFRALSFLLARSYKR